MALKNVVQVMNFHSLLRVDRSRKEAKKYSQMENMVLDMLDNILNNRNIVLDIKALKMNPEKPELRIYLGSDMGFCGNLNNQVRKAARDAGGKYVDIVVGKKLKNICDDRTLLYMTREEFNEDHSKIIEILKEGLRKKEYSSVSLVYNHYRNSSTVEFNDRVIFPIPKGVLGDQKKYTEDYIAEGDLQELLLSLVELYLEYELEICANVSVAAENINRQNITTESLKKIDEREEIRRNEERRAQRDEEFAKVLDNFTKLRHY